MSNFDETNLDLRALRQFLAVYDSGSVTAAAVRLGIGQSAVSHTLERLRGVFGDALFVRQGRGIVPTERAHGLAGDLRHLLPAMEHLLEPDLFDPAALRGQITIGADDYQRELLGPQLCQAIWAEAPDLDLRFLSPGTATAGLLRRGGCDLMISPSAPDGTEFMQSKLFSDEWRVFHAPGTPAPDTIAEYCRRPHIKVVFGDDDATLVDRKLAAEGLTRHTRLRVDSFMSLPTLIENSDLILTLTGMAGRTFMRGFASCTPPIDLPDFPFFMLWHSSQNASKRSQWVRGLMRRVVADVLAAGA